MRCIILLILTLPFRIFIPAYAYALDAELEPIVVTGAPPGIGAAYSVTPDERATVMPAASYAGNIPFLDFQSRSSGAGTGDFSIRGSSYEAVQVLLNGQRVNDPQTGHYNADIPFTSADIERIDLNAQPAIFPGSQGASAGNLSFRLKQPYGNHCIAQAQFGPHAAHAELLSISRQSENTAGRLSFDNRYSNGFRPDTDYSVQTVSAGLAQKSSAGDITLYSGWQEKDVGAYDFYSPYVGYQSREKTRTYVLQPALNARCGDIAIRPDLLWRRHWNWFTMDRTKIRSTYTARHRSDVLTPRLYIERDSDNGSAGAGTEYGLERLSSSSLGNRQRRHQSLYAGAEYELFPSISSTISGRVDGYDGFDTIVSGSAGVKKELAEHHALSLLCSRSSRIPSFTELYNNDPTTAGNVGLAPEETLGAQAGYDFREGRHTAGTAVFVRREDKIIDWVKTAGLTRWEAQNLPVQHVAGIENYCAVPLDSVTTLKGTYAYTFKRARLEEYTFKYGPNYARHLAGISSVMAFPWGTQELRATYKKKPRCDGWILLDAYLSRNLGENATVFFSVADLLNSEYQEIDGIPQPGRELSIGLRVEW